MRFEKGNKIGSAGRPKGSKNYSTIRDTITKLIEDNLPELNEDLKKMNKAKKWQTLLGLMKFAVPVLASTEVSGEIDNNINITISYDNDNNNTIDIEPNNIEELTLINEELKLNIEEEKEIIKKKANNE